jgi:pimeloyl-ACP methyl ester carboxylesterase
LAAGGPPVALERFCRFAAGDANWQALEPDLRRRMLTNAETFFRIELPTIDSYLPDAATLAAVQTPVQLLVSEQSAPFYGEIAEWLARRLRAEVSRTAGTHTPYHDHPHELAQTIRSCLARVGATSALGSV